MAASVVAWRRQLHAVLSPIRGNRSTFFNGSLLLSSCRQPVVAHHWPSSSSIFIRSTTHSSSDGQQSHQQPQPQVRLSKLLSQHSSNLAISRREAERLIQGGHVTVAGQVMTSPHFLVEPTRNTVKVHGKVVQLLSSSTSTSETNSSKIWIVHKLKGELVADFDPHGRPTMMERLIRSGVGQNKKQKLHIKPIGRLDMMTEGLMLVTTSGRYARDMELPVHQLHRTYRVRVHGPLTRYKIQAIQRGITITNDGTGGTRYSPMKVQLEQHRQRRSSTNSWITISCTEGKNRQIRNVLQHLGLTVTRLIRISFGDYQLQTIPPGMAVEVPLKDLNKQVHKGPLFGNRRNRNRIAKKTPKQEEPKASPVQWIRHYR
ncbi:Ribosomal large subunit pseudouridine synthase B [Seminavis robusta]|uniref:Ribosomal large subunit pseudouridine synthase B n=1 Tax=Seminavis robusta TaxID=568900 RepID=A0A9N8DH70_9STRA|nr:Ribosomal large subunit pseudouridine synthase B [Seminavis robusta]|eukprot:Sro125_g060040.1 Ribosomal large subunit pseudouridine synthase B (373) ;mRNA; f:1947-3332